jgi:phosphoglycolate phosphatase
VSPPGRVRGVLFDKDGTLIDFRRTWIPAYLGVAEDLAAAARRPGLGAELLRRVGFDPASGSFAKDSPLLWMTNAMIAARLAREPELHAVDVLGTIERHFSDLERYPPQPVGDLPRLLAGLRGAGLRLGLATMDSTRQAHRTAELLGVAAQLDFVTGSDGGHGTKPDPGMVLGFCAACDLSPAEVVMVGDTVADLEMGRRAGCALVVGVLTGGTPEEALAGHADHILPDITRLAGLLALAP